VSAATQPDQSAIVKELYGRRDSLPADKRAVVEELYSRFNPNAKTNSKPQPKPKKDQIGGPGKGGTPSTEPDTSFGGRFAAGASGALLGQSGGGPLETMLSPVLHPIQTLESLPSMFTPEGLGGAVAMAPFAAAIPGIGELAKRFKSAGINAADTVESATDKISKLPPKHPVVKLLRKGKLFGITIGDILDAVKEIKGGEERPAAPVPPVKFKPKLEPKTAPVPPVKPSVRFKPEAEEEPDVESTKTPPKKTTAEKIQSARYTSTAQSGQTSSREIDLGRVGEAQAKVKDMAVAKYFQNAGVSVEDVGKMTESEYRQYLKVINADRKAKGLGQFDPPRPGPNRRSFAELKADIVRAMKPEER
jgi:hypothetical protein